VFAETMLTMHGTRSIDVLKRIHPEKATWECEFCGDGRVLLSARPITFFLPPESPLTSPPPPDVQKMEGELPRLCADSAHEIPGARAFVADLTARGARWGVVTSGTDPLVRGWLGLLGIAPPAVLVTGESVAQGKPHPAPYLLGRELLGLPAGGEAEGDAAAAAAAAPPRVLVAEDSPTGTRAGKAAGCFVLGILSSATVEQLRAAGADAVVRDWSQVRAVAAAAGGVTLEIVGDLLAE
jgi:glycerol 3-phosphatase-1